MTVRASASAPTVTATSLGSPSVELAISTAALTFEVSARALRLTTLLHLPRLVVGDSLSTIAVRHEVERLARKLKARTTPYRELAAAPSPLPSSVHDLEFGPVDAQTAQVIEERFHYLASARSDASAFGVQANGKLAALATVSPLDVRPVINSMPAGVARDDVRVISRVFAFDWAPPNTITYLLARVVASVKKDDGVKLLLTYLNPNLGFTGASYRAANWTLYAREHGTRYAYLDCDYITDRQLCERFGSANPVRLRAKLGDRISFSCLALAPLELYAYFTDRHLRRKALPPLELRRPEL